jgi:Aerotolerance regulator N-terminal
MTIFWLQPWAWLGLTALIVPVVVHRLARQQHRRLLFPSLRFLHTTRLSAFRRWKITDWGLLVVRLLIVGLAVAALASPVFVSADRQRAWAARTARAVVVVSAVEDTPDAAEAPALAAEERAAAFVGREFLVRSAEIANGIRDAAMWLDQQPPAAREVVIIGDLRAGTLTAGDLAALPPHIGIRFMPLASTEPTREFQLAAISEHDATTGAYQLRTTLGDLATGVEYSPIGMAHGTVVEVRAAPAHQQRVEAARRAVLREGLVLPRDSNRRTIIEFEGAPLVPSPTIVRPPRLAWMRKALERMDNVQGGEQDGALVVATEVAGDDPRVVHLIAQVVTEAFADDRRDVEPRRVPASTLAAWARPSSGVPPDVKPGDEGDRRWIWIAVLALLAFETWMRRGRAPQMTLASSAENEEARRVA